MNASKENARQARTALDGMVESTPSLAVQFEKDVQHLSDFLAAAERKLPSEAAYKREKHRN
jgi:hypothetical protein